MDIAPITTRNLMEESGLTPIPSEAKINHVSKSEHGRAKPWEPYG